MTDRSPLGRRARRWVLAGIVSLGGIGAAADDGARAHGVREWLDATLAADPFDLATRGAAPRVLERLRRTERELRPSWSLDPSARLGYDGAWRASARARVGIPLHEPSVERRLRDARRGLARARLDDRLARRDAAETLLGTAAQWWQARHARALLDAALRRAEALPVSSAAAEELNAWRGMREEVALEQRLMREHLHELTGRDPAATPPPDPLRGGAADTLAASIPTESVDACVSRAPEVLRAERALQALRAERRARRGERSRVHLSLSGDLAVSGAPSTAGPRLGGGATVRLELGWPPEVPASGSLALAAGTDAVRLDARLANAGAPRPEPDALDGARQRLEEARFDASVRLRRAHLEYRQRTRRSGPATAEPASALRAAPDTATLLERLDAAMAALQGRTRAATLAARLAVACDPAVSSGSWSPSPTPRSPPTAPSTRSSSAPG